MFTDLKRKLSLIYMYFSTPVMNTTM